MRRLLKFIAFGIIALVFVTGLALMTFGWLALNRETLAPREAAGPGRKICSGRRPRH
jgi:hypothetical protein